MSSKSPKIPSYRLHKPTGRAVVRLDGHDYYLGKHGTPESRAAYERTVSEGLTARIVASPGAPAAPAAAAHDLVTVNVLILGFWTRHAEQHYRHADGTPTGELDNFRDSLRSLRRLYGESGASDFGPLKLQSVRQWMIEAGLARSTINQRVGRIVHVFKWGVANQLVPPEVHLKLKAVAELQKGRTAAREPGPARPRGRAPRRSTRPRPSPRETANSC
jgi:hypothetical protein